MGCLMDELVPDWVVVLMQLNSRQAGNGLALTHGREVRIDGAYLKLSLPWAGGSSAFSPFRPS